VLKLAGDAADIFLRHRIVAGLVIRALGHDRSKLQGAAVSKPPVSKLGGLETAVPCMLEVYSEKE
jgi:hypothetical protein